MSLLPLWLRRPMPLLALSVAGCAPLTFSNDASVDFAAYPSVSLELGGPDGSERQSQYLESELRVHSGFRRVTRSGLGEGEAAQLRVELTLHASADLPLVSFGTDEDEDEQPSYSASVIYRLSAKDGHVIDSGGESVDDEVSYFGAAESALDRVVLHYLRPYRL